MKIKYLAAFLLSSVLISGCDIEGEGEEELSGDISSGGSCSLTELITDADRAAANEGGIQCSSQIANADTYYTAAVRACNNGEDYQATYDVYERTAEYALSVVDSLGCGADSSGSGGGIITTPPAETASKYNLCVGYVDGGTSAEGSCYGPVLSTSSSCGSDSHLNYVGQYGSSSTCISERDAWLRTAFD